MKALVMVALLGATAQAAPEPSVRELQRAAARTAEVQPERVRAWLRRVNAAALLPSLRVRVGRGLSAIQLRGLEAYVPASDAWSFQIEAGWQLDRLVFDRSELGLSRESQRLSQRREALMIQVARLYFDRQRLMAESPPDQLAIDELTAILDGLTGGAMGK